jgi:hypothetical protein
MWIISRLVVDCGVNFGPGLGLGMTEVSTCLAALLKRGMSLLML